MCYSSCLGILNGVRGMSLPSPAFFNGSKLRSLFRVSFRGDSSPEILRAEKACKTIGKIIGGASHSAYGRHCPGTSDEKDLKGKGI